MEEKIIDIISKFATLKPADVPLGSTFKAIGLSSSVKLIRMQRLLEKETQLAFAVIHPTTIIGDVVKVGGGGAVKAAPSAKSAASAQAPAQAAMPAGFEMSIGIDIDEVENFPVVEDYFTDEFYTSVFQDDEIKYALKNKDPRIHLCGAFCAKEALIKSHKIFADLAMKDVLIVHKDDAAPEIDLGSKAKKGYSTKLSISHTEKYATAVVLCQKF